MEETFDADAELRDINKFHDNLFEEQGKFELEHVMFMKLITANEHCRNNFDLTNHCIT